MLRLLAALALAAWPTLVLAVDSSVLTALEATTAIDTFTYTENPISNGGKWTNQVLSGDANAQADGSAFTDITASDDASAYRNDAAATMSANMAAMITMVAKPGGDDGLVGIHIALQGAGLGAGTPDGYRGEIRVRTTTDEFRIQRIDAGTPTVISSGTLQEVSAGDKFAVVRSGSNIELWWKTGSTWTQVVTVSDSTYTAGGQVGLHATDLGSGGTNLLDDLKVMNLSTNRQRCIGCGVDKKVIGQ